jgi:peptidoglycan/LPS O-acetylase OafA/YrhL
LTAPVTDYRKPSATEFPGARVSLASQRNRIPELDALRGIAILGVLVLHSRFTGRFSEGTLSVQTVLARLFDWAVLAFFFASGYLHRRPTPFWEVVKKRFASLLAPFFIYNLLYNISFAAAGILGRPPLGETNGHSVNFVGWLLWSPAFQLYFLPYLFVITVGICGLEKLAGRHPESIYYLTLLLATGYYIWHGYPAASHGAEFEKFPLYVAMFLIGTLGRSSFEQSHPHPVLVIVVLSILISILEFSPFPFVSFAVPPTMLALARAMPRMSNAKVLLTMGTMSGSIYVWHTPLLLPVCTRFMAILGVPSMFILFGSLGLTLGICVLLRFGLDWFFEQILHRSTPRMITL